MAGKIDAADLPPGVREQLGLPNLATNGSAKAKRGKSASGKMTADEERSYVLRVLTSLAALTKAERTRVLKRALHFNGVL